MASKEHLPDPSSDRAWFPDILKRGEYQRLVALARRRLVGLEHHAEDVVSQAMIKWANIRPERRAVARIEQIIKTEAFSLIRSERRWRNRDTRATGDPTNPIAGNSRTFTDQEVVVFRQTIAEAIKRTEVPVTRQDLEVLELLMAGFSLSDIVRRTGMTRYQVRRSQGRWKVILRTLNEPATAPTTAS